LEVNTLYLYPDNLKAKATLFLWELKDIGIIGVGLLLSVFVLAKIHIFLPIVVTAVYAFLSIRFEGTSIKDFIANAIGFFFLKPQTYRWEMNA
jgi:hypothetical protein